VSDIYNLKRFVDAQSEIYELAVGELKSGRKTSCWMWYIFPQIKGLGHSLISKEYAISSKLEAKSYSEHPILGPRLIECTQIVIDIEGCTAEQIFHEPDYLKFRSCMTLFEYSVANNEIFRIALLKYFDGKPDPLTLAILECD